jgi:hypothetical protein
MPASGTDDRRSSSVTQGLRPANFHENPLRYVQVTQQDLQHEFHRARRNATQSHRLPTLPLPNLSATADLGGIRQALAATRHVLEMYRRQMNDEQTRRKLQRLDRRLRAVDSQLDLIATAEK